MYARSALYLRAKRAKNFATLIVPEIQLSKKKERERVQIEFGRTLLLSFKHIFGTFHLKKEKYLNVALCNKNM